MYEYMYSIHHHIIKNVHNRILKEIKSAVQVEEDNKYLNFGLYDSLNGNVCASCIYNTIIDKHRPQ